MIAPRRTLAAALAAGTLVFPLFASPATHGRPGVAVSLSTVTARPGCGPGSGRSARGERFMVVAADPAAAAAGCAVLRDGGGAADAAVAVQAVLAVVEPQSSGRGGGSQVTWARQGCLHTALGHPCAVAVPLRSGAALVEVTPGGHLRGAADPRRDGAAMGG
ncbi:gamma-glutamyltransferase [Streptomyces sp. NPDC001667]